MNVEKPNIRGGHPLRHRYLHRGGTKPLMTSTEMRCELTGRSQLCGCCTEEMA